MTRSISTLVLLCSLWSAHALGGEAVTWAVQSGTVTYRLVHKFHEVKGVSSKVEGKARVLPEGKLQAAVRIPVASFDSGNGNRDVHMLETVEATRFPTVEFKGAAPQLALPEKFPATQTVKVDGQLTFHGVTLPQSVELKLEFTDRDHVHAQGTFPISLEAFGVERPSLMFIAVDDKLVMDLDLQLGAAVSSSAAP